MSEEKKSGERGCWLSVGSNLGDRWGLLRESLLRLECLGVLRLAAISSVWETEPVGLVDQPDFLNLCVAGVTLLEPLEVLRGIQSVEHAMGRERTVPWGPRLIDIDLVAMEGVSCTTPELTLPHMRAQTRAFVLVPLSEIAPELEIAGLPVVKWLQKVDVSGVRAYQVSLKTNPQPSID